MSHPRYQPCLGGNELAKVLEMQGIVKGFPGVLANDHVDFDLEEGEIHALVGENGAGKSTLMNILYGLYQPDEGRIVCKGRQVRFESPLDSIAAGIGMVHQHFMLVPSFTVYENIVLGAEPRRRGSFDRAKAISRVRELAKRHDFRIDPLARIHNLPVGSQQRVEIMKSLYRGAGILILDEPTAVLTPQETKELFVILKSLARQGKTIVFITHKLEEVMEVSDRVTVMRGGKVTMTKATAQTDAREIARMMVGREVFLQVNKADLTPGEVMLEVENLWVADDRGLFAVKGLSFQVREGEILGVAGVAGNGQMELAEAITGLRPVQAGRIRVCGQDITGNSPFAIRSAGLAHIPEDRYKHGLAKTGTVEENAIMFLHNFSPITNNGLLNRKAITEHADSIIENFDVRPRDRKALAGQLSGGNAQKLIVGREMTLNDKVLVACQPTRGLDIGAIEFLHNRIVQQRDHGSAVLLISVELDEVMSLSDWILVMYEGKSMGELDARAAAVEEVGRLMAGIGKRGSSGKEASA